MLDHVGSMISSSGETHDRIVAECLGTAAAWAYSDVGTFARNMHRRGGIPFNETVSVRVVNNALLVHTTAFVTQSRDKKLVVLSFGGTDPVSLIQLLMDVTAKTDKFWTAGDVHGSFLRAALALWPTLKKLLHIAIEGGGSICGGAQSERSQTREACKFCGGMHAGNVCPDGEASSRSDLCPAPSSVDQESASALYITGHSLGGALAVVTAALIYQDPDAKPIRDRLRAIYTFGQPMVGNADFADAFQDIIGRKLFRHVYGKDLVPTLPSKSAGIYRHIGTELSSSAEKGWVSRLPATRQSLSFALSLSLGILAFAFEQLPNVPFVRKLRLPWSLYDHLPINYLRASRVSPLGFEFR
ncbi:lipase family protein [Sorangium sp. So ce1097]|uniref:lipase family protein n=1 Tax=Sorangium sp. So ce1097 TaxID=3133330 RepID=UPI003F647F6A